MPTAEEVLKRVEAADTRRFGAELLNAVTKENQDIQAKIEKQGEELSWLYAEIFEHLYRKQGMHPAPRIFLPGKDF
jgi:hypothetical protein